MKLRKRKEERGAILLFLVVVVAILSLYVDRLLPKVEPQTPRLKTRTIDEVNELAWNLREYYFDMKTFPELAGSRPYFLTNSSFVGAFFNHGINASLATYTGEYLYDQWGTSSLYVEENGGDTPPDYRNFWSVGPDFTSDTGGDDDIARKQYATVSATARTRRLLAIIRAACIYYAVDLDGSNATTDWAGSTKRRGSGSSLTPTGGANLGAEFDKDGWGNNFRIETSTSRIKSFGPNEVDGDDDIVW